MGDVQNLVSYDTVWGPRMGYCRGHEGAQNFTNSELVTMDVWAPHAKLVLAVPIVMIHMTN